MLVKKNIKLKLPSRKQIQYHEYNVLNEDDKFLLTFKCEKEHHLSIGDHVILTRQAFIADTYSEALKLATEDRLGWLIVSRDNSSDDQANITELEKGVFTLGDEPIVKYGVEYFPVKEATDSNIGAYFNVTKGDANYPAGIYVVGCDGVVNSVTDGQKVYCVFGEGKLKELTTQELQRITQQYGTDGLDDMKVINNETFTKKCFTIVMPMYRGVEIDKVLNEYVILRRPLPFSLVKGTEFSLCARKKDLYGVVIKDEDRNTSMHKIKCVVNDPYSFTVLDGTEIQLTEPYYIRDSRFLQDNLRFWYGVSVYEGSASFSIPLGLSNEGSPEMCDEEHMQHMFAEKKKSLISPITDFEKKCFAPYHITGVRNRVEQIKIKLFLRDRYDYDKGVNSVTGNNILSDNWGTDDTKGWFQCPLDNSGKPDLSKFTGHSDLLGYFAFTDDDVYYRKKKLAKSFLRLSFYDSPDPSTHMLLFYSTVFFDVGESYEKYINNVQRKLVDPNFVIVENNELNDVSKRVSADFLIHDKHDHNKSSEGFYLYLFPDGVGGGEERTVYMKMEFNHAGYGKTVPLILPNNGLTSLTPDLQGFPFSFTEKTENGISLNLKKFYQNQYIPVKLRYDEELEEYIYYIPYGKYDSAEHSLTLNMFEPRLNDVY